MTPAQKDPSLFPVSDHVFPIVVEDVEAQRYVSYEGNGFVPVPGVLVTCWHCIAKSLPANHRYVAVKMNDYGNNPGRFQNLPLAEISQDRSGTDLATASVEHTPETPLAFPSGEIFIGNDVWAFGFPFSNVAQRGGLALSFRTLKGYISRVFDHETADFGTIPSYELDMPAPAGMSGAPLFTLKSLVGMVYGELESYTINDWFSVDERGIVQPESRKVITFALAHRVEALRGVRGAATRDRALAELM